VSDDVLARVQSLVLRTAGPRRTSPDAGPDTPLGEGGFWLDSVDMLDLILACEHEFGTAFGPSADLSAEALHTIRSLADFIRVRVSA
jgi:acyl carrier protein